MRTLDFTPLLRRVDNLPFARLQIGVRLRLAFVCLMSLMFAGAALSLWQFQRVGASVERASRAGRGLTVVLALDNSMLTLMNRLHRASDTRDPARFEATARKLLADFRSETADVPAELSRNALAPAGREVVLLDSLTAIFEQVPARIDALIELARADDWLALRARVENQVDRTDDVISALETALNADLAATRGKLVEDVNRAERRTVLLLIATGLFSLAAAALLGLIVTRGITHPLARLGAGARALARGDFGHRVQIEGSDELAHLSSVFNWMADELKDLYAKTRRSEAHFRALIEKASDLILVATRAGDLVYASPSSVRVLGISPDDLIGRSIHGAVHPDDAPLVDAFFSENSVAPGAMQPFEWRFLHSDGSSRILEGLASNLAEDDSVGGIVMNARDVSEKRQAEQALREREDQLRQAQKMEAIGQLAGGVAHDFNNLLTAINGYSDLLLTAAPTGEKSQTYLREIRDAGERASALTRQLLAFSRRQVLQPAVVDLNEVVRDTERLLRRVIGEDVAIVCNLARNGASVKADPHQIHQVLMNLAVNARDAMPEGGRLTIATAIVTAADVPAGSEGAGSSASYVELTISDTGHGIDSETRARIFEPFFTTKEKGKGTGLGLAIVYGIVQQSGGQIVVESELGSGTAFRIFLPRVESALEKRSAVKPSPPAGGSETILLVEDQPEVRRFAATCCRSFGYNVIEAGSGEEALDVWQTAKERIHLLLTDVVMPGINGVELSQKLLAFQPDLKVLLVSGYADSVTLRHGVLESGTSFLQKPYTPAALAARIRELLGQSQSVPKD